VGNVPKRHTVFCGRRVPKRHEPSSFFEVRINSAIFNSLGIDFQVAVSVPSGNSPEVQTIKHIPTETRIIQGSIRQDLSVTIDNIQLP
jgi:hypothetical protein